MSGRSDVTGSTSANVLASDADVVIAVGTRLQELHLIGSWSVFGDEVLRRVGELPPLRHRQASRIPVASATLRPPWRRCPRHSPGHLAPQEWSDRARTLVAAVATYRRRSHGPARDGDLVPVVCRGDRSRHRLPLRGRRRGGRGPWPAGSSRQDVAGIALQHVRHRARGSPAWGTRSAGPGAPPWHGGLRHRPIPSGDAWERPWRRCDLDVRRRLLISCRAWTVRRSSPATRSILVLCDNGGYSVIQRLQVFKGGARLQQPVGRGHPTGGRRRGRLRRPRRSHGRRGRAGGDASTSSKQPSPEPRRRTRQR